MAEPGATRDVATWLETLCAAAEIEAKVGYQHGPGDPLPTKPDRMVIVARTGGPGWALDGAMDDVAFQLRIRGGENNYDDAEDLALSVDRAVLDSRWPQTIGGWTATIAQRVGGPPAFLVRDPARRTHFTCNYVLSIARY